MQRTIHALLIGINNYHPSSKVRSLGGCISDLNKVKKVLTDHYQCLDSNIKTLENDEATRKAIITTFQTHLCNNTAIKEGDVVFFYFSGHGSYARTAREFESFDAQKQDETLVCYDSRIPDGTHFDLTDKELAVLLEQVKPKVEIVVIVDACHSDSITRSPVDEVNEELTARFTTQRKTSRNLASYFLSENNYYTALEKMVIPHRQHIVLSACAREQKAWEKLGSGVFTKAFLSVLKQANYRISYRRLYELTCAKVENNVKNQTPQIAIPSGFDMDKIFLKPSTYQGDFSQQKMATQQAIFLRQAAALQFINYRNGNWCLNNGTIYGLPTDKKLVAALQVAVYREIENEFQFLENVGVNAVKLKECHLVPNLFDELYAQKLNSLPKHARLAEKEHPTYWGKIVAAKPNLFIYLNGTAEEQQAFLDFFAEQDAPFISFLTSPEDTTSYEVKFELDTLLIKRRETDQLIHGCFRGEDDFAYIIERLQQIEEWERITKLNNPKTELAINQVEVQFLEEKSGKYYQSSTIHLHGADEGILFQIHARNLSNKDLYIGLVHLSPQFGIESFYECEKFPAENKDWITLDNRHVLGFGKKQKYSVIDTFKVIISTQPFDDYKFHQKSFLFGEIVLPQLFRDALLRGENPPESDWFTHTITTHLTRLEASLSTTDTSLNKHITINGHPSFLAKVGLAALNASTKDIHPAQHLSATFKNSSFELIDIAPYPAADDFSDKTIIYLDEIEKEVSLEKKPLTFKIDKTLLDKKQVLPITFDGELFLPIGTTQKDKTGNSIIHLEYLPTIEEAFVAEQTRSAKRALWFCLLNFIPPYKEQAFQLKYIWKYENGAPLYGQLLSPQPVTKKKEVAITDTVKKANKILLLVHGIIGNTETMAQMVAPFFENEAYPLILTFDYENLNTKIEEIADKLDAALTNIGLDKNSSKTIDVIAHSMGGLVVRYLIERIRKNHPLVDKLILVGTPNGGSRFSDMTKYRDISLVALTVAANTSKYLIPTFAPWLFAANGVVGAANVIATTLKQMHPESSFIKDLYRNDPAPGTQYYIIAGDVQQYHPAGNWWDKLKAHFTLKKYQWVYQETPSDLIVSVAQITHVPDSFNAKIVEVGCHHMNYFRETAAINAIMKCLDT